MITSIYESIYLYFFINMIKHDNNVIVVIVVVVV